LHKGMGMGDAARQERDAALHKSEMGVGVGVGGRIYHQQL